MIDLIELGIFNLDQGDVEGVKSHLNEALGELRKRQKLIKIADRSPQGWATVKEYVSDVLADNSDDEKRLRKAEKSATAKKEASIC